MGWFFTNNQFKIIRIFGLKIKLIFKIPESQTKPLTVRFQKNNPLRVPFMCQQLLFILFMHFHHDSPNTEQSRESPNT